MGGPARSVTALCDYLAAVPGVQVALLTQHRSGETIIEPDSEKVRFHAVPVCSVPQARAALGFRRGLARSLDSAFPSIVHAHGVWDATTYWSALLARRHGAAFVLHPRGMLEPWCLRYKAFKKKLAMALYTRRMLESVDLFVATAQQEMEAIRSLGFRQPVAVLPNGIEVPKRVRNGENRESGKRALFLSRIHPVKGVVNLIRAWARVAPNGWKLTVAGPNENNYWNEVNKEIGALGLQDQIAYVGEVKGDVKERLFLGSDLFILPSFSENFGIAVAEALGYGLPVITTTGTPWQGLVERECGWWAEPSVEGLTNALQDATQRPPAELREMGDRGREYAQEFDWSRIARQMAEVYLWLLGRGEIPACVVLD